MITRGHLLRNQAEPRRKVAPLCKGSAVADRSHHCTCNDRADTRNRHQLLTARVAARQGLDLIRHVFDSLIEMRPVGCGVCPEGYGGVLLVLLSLRSLSERFGAGARWVHSILRARSRLAASRATMRARHVGLGPGLVGEDQHEGMAAGGRSPSLPRCAMIASTLLA